MDRRGHRTSSLGGGSCGACRTNDLSILPNQADLRTRPQSGRDGAVRATLTVFAKGWKRERNSDNATTGLAGRETQPFPPPFGRTVAATFSNDLPVDGLAIRLEPLPSTMMVSAPIHLRHDINLAAAPSHHRGRGTSDFPPLVAFLIRPLLARPLTGESSAGGRSGRYAP